MGIRIGSVVVNCADLEVMTEFWAQTLGLVPSSRDPGDDFRVLRGERVNLSLQKARTPVTARDQMHLDLFRRCDLGREAALSRRKALRSCGARELSQLERLSA